MKSRVTLLSSIIDDFIEMGVAFSSRDKQEIARRCESEGYPFLASRLPSLDDALLRGLRQGHFPHLNGWKMKDHVPLIFNGAFAQVFDKTGAILLNPNPTAIRALRQVCRLFKKVFEVCDDDKVQSAVSSFEVTDSEVLTSGDFKGAKDVLSAIMPYSWRVAFSRSELHGAKHGPGATAERCNSTSKWSFPTIPERIADRFGLEWFLPVYSDWGDAILAEQPARLTAVPKTFDKPRLISIEPVATQFVQQHFLGRFELLLHRFPAIQNVDQSRNREMALRGSIDGSLATLDLSEASDRLSWHFVKVTFPAPIVRALEVCRSRTIELPSGQELPLRKFASMGSALTFPVQILAFFSLVVAGICQQEGNWDPKFIRSWLTSGDIGVYGDDIVIPTRYALSVMSSLRGAGLVVNETKSFWEGDFRESCGGDYFRGLDVTPVYVRKHAPSDRRHTKEVLAWADLSLQLGAKGLVRAAIYASSLVEKVVTVSQSQVIPDFVGMGYGKRALIHDRAIRVWSSSHTPKVRYNANLQRHETLETIVVPERREVDAPDHAKLARALARVKGSASTLEDYKRIADPIGLEYDERPAALRIKRRWVPAM